MPQGCARPLSAEGLKKLFSGATMASSRGALVTVGQVGWRGRGLGQCMAQQEECALTAYPCSFPVMTKPSSLSSPLGCCRTTSSHTSWPVSLL